MHVVLLMLVLALAARAAPVRLTAPAFHEATQAQAVFVNFHADWCHHCIRFDQTFRDLEALRPAARLAEVDCIADRALCRALGVKEFPELRLYLGGREIVYNGRRKASVMFEWIAALAE